MSVHPEAASGRDSRRGGLPPGRHQPSDYFNWKKKYDGLLPTEMKRLKQLEDENSKLRKLVADLSQDKIVGHNSVEQLSARFVRTGRYRRVKF